MVEGGEAHACTKIFGRIKDKGMEVPEYRNKIYAEKAGTTITCATHPQIMAALILLHAITPWFAA